MQTLNFSDTPIRPVVPPIRPVVPPIRPVVPPIRPVVPPNRPIGGGTDAYGCRTAAGYTWCPREGRCVRLWEVAKERGLTPFQARRYCNRSPRPRPPRPRPRPRPPIIIGGRTDIYGCNPSAGYTWCPREGRCVRPWELANQLDESVADTMDYCNYNDPPVLQNKPVLVLKDVEPEEVEPEEDSKENKTTESEDDKKFPLNLIVIIFILIIISIIAVLSFSKTRKFPR